MGDERDDERGGELATVATFETVGAAEAARGLLTAAGIPAVVHERDLFRLDPFRPHERPSIRLQVPTAEAGRARELLEAPSG